LAARIAVHPTIKVVSTVLRPVGPLPPRIYWVRRGVLLAAVLLLIIIIAVSCSGGGTKKPTAGNTPGPQTTPTSTNVAACLPTSLKLALQTDKPIYAIGSPATFTGVFTNITAVACRLTMSPANETWKVTSGTPTVWTNEACQRSQVARTKTIAPGGSRRVHIQWDGKVQTSGCTAGDPAQSGTYVLRATLDGYTAQTGAVFHYTPNGQ
jgi:hypothetical protein